MPRTRHSSLPALALALVLGLVATALVALGAAPATARADEESNDVVTWGASADRVGGSLTDQTVRNIVHTSTAGDSLRISLSNVFGDAPVTFGSVYVGQQADGAALVPGSNRRATFSGLDQITVPPGAEVLSDPVDVTVPAGTDLAVSVHVVGGSGALTGHNLARQISWVSGPGDVAADEGGAAYPNQTQQWFWLDALVVRAAADVDTVATLGDSITDGFASTVGANNRWPDLLADRLEAGPESQRFAVMNEGISGNQVLRDSAGVSALARFDRDVLSQPGVRTVVLLEGINDIGSGGASAAQVIAGYRQLIARAHADGTCIVGGTLTPFKGTGAPYFTREKNGIRREVNRFIRTSREFDAVIDFDRATRDPASTQRLLPAYDSGDHLHPGDAGYAAMAAAVDASVLECGR